MKLPDDYFFPIQRDTTQPTAKNNIKYIFWSQ